MPLIGILRLMALLEVAPMADSAVMLVTTTPIARTTRSTGRGGGEEVASRATQQGDSYLVANSPMKSYC